MDSLLQKRSFRLSLLLAIVIVAIAGVYWLSDIFGPLLFSLLVAYMLDPVADALERRKFTRLAAVITIFTSMTLVIVVVVGIAGFYLTRGVIDLYDSIRGDRLLTAVQVAELPNPNFMDDVRILELPDDHPLAAEGGKYYDYDQDGNFSPGYLQRAIKFIEGLQEKESEESAESDPNDTPEPGEKFLADASQWLEKLQEGLTEDKKDRLVAQISERASWLFGGPLQGGGGERGDPTPEADPGPGFISSLFTWFSWLLLCPLYIFYLLLEIDPIVEKSRRYLPGRHREKIVRLMSRIDRTMSAFFRGRLTICIIKGLGTSIGLYFLGVPFAIPLGIAAGFLALVPYIGIWFAIIPSLLLVWLEFQSFGRILGVGAVFAAMEGIEGFVLIPKVLGKEVGLHPLAVIVTMLIFAELLGFIGILLSVPLAAIAKILAEEFLLPLIESFAAEEPGAPPDASG